MWSLWAIHEKKLFISYNLKIFLAWAQATKQCGPYLTCRTAVRLCWPQLNCVKSKPVRKMSITLAKLINKVNLALSLTSDGSSTRSNCWEMSGIMPLARVTTPPHEKIRLYNKGRLLRRLSMNGSPWFKNIFKKNSFSKNVKIQAKNTHNPTQTKSFNFCTTKLFGHI